MLFLDGSEDGQKYNSSKVNSGRMNRTSGWSSSRVDGQRGRGRRVSEGRKEEGIGQDRQSVPHRCGLFNFPFITFPSLSFSSMKLLFLNFSPFLLSSSIFEMIRGEFDSSLFFLRMPLPPPWPSEVASARLLSSSLEGEPPRRRGGVGGRATAA